MFYSACREGPTAMGGEEEEIVLVVYCWMLDEVFCLIFRNLTRDIEEL